MDKETEEEIGTRIKGEEETARRNKEEAREMDKETEEGNRNKNKGRGRDRKVKKEIA